jgi:hypothetical protein
MKRIALYGLALVAVAAMTWVAGCSTPGDPADTSGTNLDDIINRDENPNLNDSFGGYNMKDDVPAFADEQLAREETGDVDYDDPFAQATDIRTLETSDRRQLFLMITWGNLHRDSTITGPTDWSGSLSVDNGVVLLKRTIAFEMGDHIVPRTQRDLLEWKSQTYLGGDGILVKVHPAPVPVLSNVAVPDTVDSSSVVIHFETTPLSVEFTLAQLPGLNRVVTLPDGNAVSFTAVEQLPGRCPHGLMQGVWRNHPEREGGVFRGRWATADGSVRGFMKGIYGTNDAGDRVFYGKMIDENGRFEGIMRGVWGNHAGMNGGWFAGRWVDRNLKIRGELKGEWRRSDRCHGGFYRARWAMNCNRDGR